MAAYMHSPLTLLIGRNLCWLHWISVLKTGQEAAQRAALWPSAGWRDGVEQGVLATCSIRPPDKADGCFLAQEVLALRARIFSLLCFFIAALIDAAMSERAPGRWSSRPSPERHPALLDRPLA